MELTPEKIEILQDLHVAHQQRKTLFEENKTRLPNLFSEDEIRDLWNRIKRTDLLLYEYRVHLNNYEIPEEYIPKKQFILLVLELLLEYIESEDKDEIVKYAPYSFDPEQFRKEFTERAYVHLRTPFFKQLADEILAAEIIKGIAEVWNEYGRYKKSDLLPHYKKEGNKEYYRGKEAKTHFLISDFEFIKGSLGICIKDAINDPKFPEIKQKLEEERRKLEEERKEFGDFYRGWKADQRLMGNQVANKDSSQGSVISRNKFLAIYLSYNQNWGKVQPELDKYLFDRLFSSLKEDSISLKKLGEAMSFAVTTISVPDEVVFKNWQKNRTEFPDYGAILAAITRASEFSIHDITEAYLGWYAEVAGAVDALKTPKEQQYITQKLLDGMKGLLSNRKKLAFLYAPFEELVSRFNKRYVQSWELSYAWRESLCRGIMNAKNIESAFAEELSSKTISVEGLRNTLNGLAGVDTLQVIFQSALRPPVRSYALRKGPNLKLPVSFSDGTNLLITIQTKIQKFKDKKGKEVPYVTVQEEGVSCTISKSGNKGFDYEIKDLLVSDYEHTDGTVYVDYEYTIALRGQRNDQTTSEETYEENTTGKEESKSETETSSTSHSLSIGKTVGVDILFVSAESNIDYTLERTTGREVSVSSAFMSSQLQGKSQGRSVTAHGGVEALAFTINARLKSSNIGSETLDVESAQTVDRLRRGEQTINFFASIKQAGLNWKR